MKVKTALIVALIYTTPAIAGTQWSAQRTPAPVAVWEAYSLKTNDMDGIDCRIPAPLSAALSYWGTFPGVRGTVTLESGGLLNSSALNFCDDIEKSPEDNGFINYDAILGA